MPQWFGLQMKLNAKKYNVSYKARAWILSSGENYKKRLSSCRALRALLPIARHLNVSPLTPILCGLLGDIEPARLPFLVSHFEGFQGGLELFLH